jgi:glycerol transport system ATP-binding protein
LSLVLDDIGLAVGSETLIANVSMRLEAGSMNVLLGPTLSGKTTLMRLMAGLDRPTSGRIVVDGADVTGVQVRRRSVAMVYQQFVNYPSLSVYENIASPLRVAKIKAKEIESRVGETARLLGLEPLLRRTPHELSGGQQQRVAIARALVKRARLVLLDEPLANLDYKLREELREELPRLFAASGAILVYATAEPGEALELGGNTATLWQGRLTQIGATAEVYRHPRHVDVARVFSDPPLNELEVRKEGGFVHLPGDRQVPAMGALAGLSDNAYRIALRAEDIVFGAAASSAIGFKGTVLVSEITGSETFVHVDVGHGTWVSVLRGVHDIAPGAPVEVHIDMRRVFVFGTDGVITASPVMAATA